MATIFVRTFGMQLLAKNADMKESLMQTEAIGIAMQSSLRDGIITGHLLHKYHESVPFSEQEMK